MKEHKQYNNIVLVIVLVVFLILGAYTWSPVSQVQITDIYAIVFWLSLWVFAPVQIT